MYRFVRVGDNSVVLMGYEGDFDTIVEGYDGNLETIIKPYKDDGYKVIIFCSDVDKFVVFEYDRVKIF